jgi:hypothetical protein
MKYFLVGKIECSFEFLCFVLVALPDNTVTENGNDSADSTPTTEELFESLYEFLCSSLALHMQHTYASHILRVLFEVLAGQPVAESVVRSRLSRHQQQAKSKLSDEDCNLNFHLV